MDEEALDRARAVELVLSGTAISTRILQAEHLVANAVLLQRPQDQMRISLFLDEDKVDLATLAEVLTRHDLLERWSHYCQMTGRDPSLGGRLKR